MVIYKIFRTSEWDALCAAGETAGAPVDLADGYIHFSAAGQLRETAAKHFAGLDDLVLAQVDGEALGAALAWEQSRGGALFPHLYRALRRDEVIAHSPLTLGPDGAHIFPDDIP
ncbi:MAG: DUF952 domain-containing protein [Mangrovicoccus sp.]|nr:DUF952 domain-containing protein [Mangrovicoccus sp.]